MKKNYIAGFGIITTLVCDPPAVSTRDALLRIRLMLSKVASFTHAQQ